MQHRKITRFLCLVILNTICNLVNLLNIYRYDTYATICMRVKIWNESSLSRAGFHLSNNSEQGDCGRGIVRYTKVIVVSPAAKLFCTLHLNLTILRSSKWSTCCNLSCSIIIHIVFNGFNSVVLCCPSFSVRCKMIHVVSHRTFL